MEDIESTLILIALSLSAIALPLAIFQEKKRKETRLQDYEKMSFKVVDSKSFYDLTALKRFKIINGTKWRSTFSETMLGKYKGYEFGAFHRSLADGSDIGDRATAVLIKTKSNIPDFALWPEGFVDKAKDAAMGQNSSDIDIDGLVNFSGDYHLESENEIEIRRIFSSRVANYFVDLNNMVSASFYVECRGGDLLIFKSCDLLTEGSQITKYLDRGIEIYKLLSGDKDDDEVVSTIA